MFWLSEGARRFLVLGVFALMAWYSFLFVGRVRAAYVPPALTLNWQELMIGAPESNESENVVQKLQVQSSVPGCEATELQLTWYSPYSHNLPRLLESVLGWDTSSEDTVFTITSDCSEPVELSLDR